MCARCVWVDPRRPQRQNVIKYVLLFGFLYEGQIWFSTSFCRKNGDFATVPRGRARTCGSARLSGMLNRPTVRVRYRFSELEACALKRASLRAPSSFANAETIVENLKKGMFVLPCRSAPGLRLLRRSLTRRSRVARGGHRIGSSLLWSRSMACPRGKPQRGLCRRSDYATHGSPPPHREAASLGCRL